MGYIRPNDPKNSSYESYLKCLEQYEAKVGYKSEEPLKKRPKLRKNSQNCPKFRLLADFWSLF